MRGLPLIATCVEQSCMPHRADLCGHRAQFGKPAEILLRMAFALVVGGLEGCLCGSPFFTTCVEEVRFVFRLLGAVQGFKR